MNGRESDKAGHGRGVVLGPGSGSSRPKWASLRHRAWADLIDLVLPALVLAGPYCPWAVWAVLAPVAGIGLLASWRSGESRRLRDGES